MKTCFNFCLCVALGLEPEEYEEGVGQSLKALRAWNGEGCVGAWGLDIQKGETKS